MPLALRASFGSAEVVVSLMTTRLRIARRRADEVDRRLDFAFACALAAANEGERRGFLMGARRWIEELARNWALETLDDWEKERATTGDA